MAREGLRSVTQGTLLLLFGALGLVAGNFASRVLLARTLSTVELGEFSIGLTLAGLLVTLGSLGLPNSLARNLPFHADDTERRALIRAAALILLPASAAVAGALVVVGIIVGDFYGLPLLAEALEFFAVASALQLLASLISSVFQGFEDVRPNALYIQVVTPVLFIAFLVIGLVGFPSSSRFTGALSAYLASSALTMVGMVLYSRRHLPARLPPGPRRAGLMRPLVDFAVPLFVVSLLGYATGNVDTLVLGSTHNAQAGFYYTALLLARLLPVGLSSVGFIILPVTTRLFRSGDLEAVRITYATATKWITLTSLPLFILFFFLPTACLTFVFGASYAGSATALRIVALGSFAATVVGPAAPAQVSFGQTRLLVYNSVASAAADVVLSLWLVPPFGLQGAAIAWAVASGLAAVLSAVELAVLTRVHPFQSHYLVPLIATGVPCAAALLWLGAPGGLWLLPVEGLGIAVLFVALVLLTGSVDRGDRLLLEVAEGMLGRPLRLVRRVGEWRRRLGGG